MRTLRLLISLGVCALIFTAAVVVLCNNDALRVVSKGDARHDPDGKALTPVALVARAEQARATRRAAGADTSPPSGSPAASTIALVRLDRVGPSRRVTPRPHAPPEPPPSFGDVASEIRWFEGELADARDRVDRLDGLAARMDESGGASPEVQERIASELAQARVYTEELESRLADLTR